VVSQIINGVWHAVGTKIVGRRKQHHVDCRHLRNNEVGIGRRPICQAKIDKAAPVPLEVIVELHIDCRRPDLVGKRSHAGREPARAYTFGAPKGKCTRLNKPLIPCIGTIDRCASQRSSRMVEPFTGFRQLRARESPVDNGFSRDLFQLGQMSPNRVDRDALASGRLPEATRIANFDKELQV